jgi:hypothetical protein
VQIVVLSQPGEDRVFKVEIGHELRYLAGLSLFAKSVLKIMRMAKFLSK